MPQRDLQHLLSRRHFQIQRKIGCRLNACQIFITDMTAVFAQMRGDPVATHASDNLCGSHRVGVITAARIANRRDVIDVHAQAKALRVVHVRHQARLPGFVIGTAASSAGTSSSA